jgi:hypothetical protein
MRNLRGFRSALTTAKILSWRATPHGSGDFPRLWSAALVKVGWLDVRKTTPGVVYSALTLPSARDFSDEINAQIAAAGGEAVVGMAVSISGRCGWLNGFPILNALPVWPGCVPVKLTGEIVKRRNIGP